MWHTYIKTLNHNNEKHCLWPLHSGIHVLLLHFHIMLEETFVRVTGENKLKKNTFSKKKKSCQEEKYAQKEFMVRMDMTLVYRAIFILNNNNIRITIHPEQGRGEVFRQVRAQQFEGPVVSSGAHFTVTDGWGFERGLLLDCVMALIAWKPFFSYLADIRSVPAGERRQCLAPGLSVCCYLTVLVQKQWLAHLIHTELDAKKESSPVSFFEEAEWSNPTCSLVTKIIDLLMCWC